MSTHEQITNNPTSAVRNTGGRNGPQGIEEPMSDEVLREMCDKNYHQLLPLIAEKMQKEKEQKDRLNAVKARLIYGEESGVKIRNHEESYYSESKTPTARTEPRKRHGGRYSRSPSPHGAVVVMCAPSVFDPSSWEVNADDSADKSLSGTFVQPVTQPKATTARKPRKKTIPSSTRLEALNLRRIETSSSSQATHLQPSEELVVSANETKSLDVSESTGAQENQNETAEAEKVLNIIVKENMEEKDKDEDHSFDVEQLLDEIAKYAEVTLMRFGPMDMDAQTADSEFELKSMPDDDL
ncbi:hypothetical protein Tco_0454274 [Tanacetum coccineum]